ncbi:SIR2 family protein [Rhizobium leguminosarum]|uniref:SIR2 family protein n=1 Tax=Rhizobium leguminosarum TaxID=384 RepID=A0A7W9ZY87_RHILE|nr:SIR2 family protein [Rhizobium leguminosarum]MBB6224986.1 hypothetical protein [Rhizobium leguminosarum]
MTALIDSQLLDIFQQRPQNLAWFLGAGASRNAGLPTAGDIIWDMKRRYYEKEENQAIAPQDMQSEAVRSKVQSFMDARGFPALWADEEYSKYFEKIFGTDRERQRKYLIAMLSEAKVSLSIGNRVLGALLAGEFSRVVFTTNFDTVVEKAVAEMSGGSLSAYHLEGTGSARRALDNEEYPFYCKLHGDFRYESLKNLSSDLATQNAELGACMVNAGSRFGFVVAGYSGRDASVMDLFNRVLASSNPFPHGLFWTGIGRTPHPAVDALITNAKKANVHAEYVEIDTYDTLMSRLWRLVAAKPTELDRKIRKSNAAQVNIPLAAVSTKGPILRTNALPILSLPNQCHEVSSRRAIDWAELRSLQQENDHSFIATKTDSVLVWGTEPNIRAAFGNELKGLQDRALPRDFSGPQNLPLKSFLEEAIAVAMARGKSLLTRMKPSGAFLIADIHAEDKSDLSPLRNAVQSLGGTITGLLSPISAEHPTAEKVGWAEALRVTLDQRGGHTWIVVQPDIWIWPQYAREVATEFLDKRKGGRFNRQHNEILDGWLKVILGEGERTGDAVLTAFQGPPSVGNPSFTLSRRTAFSRKLAR